MGGFMPTPAAPAQPPQVKLDTTADSRGTFNSFLRSMNGATSLNPPSMAPLQGVIADPLAPALSNIDIFNQPVQMMFTGGEVDDFSQDTSGDFSVDDSGNVTDDFSFSGDDSDNFAGTGGTEEEFQKALEDERSTDFTSEDIFQDDAQASAGTNVGLEKSGGFSAGVLQNALDPRFTAFRSPSFAMRGIARDFRSKIRGAEDKNQDLTVGDYFNKFNPSDDNKNRLSEFESLTGKKAGDKLNIGDMQNIMNIQAKYEAGIRNVAPSVQKAILNTVDIEDDKKVESILGDLDLGKSLLTEPKDFLEIKAPGLVGNPRIGSPALAGLPGVASRFNKDPITSPKSEIQALRDAVANTIRQAKADDRPLSDTEKALQQNVLTERGRALGPVTFGDDLANFAQGERSRPFDEISRVGDDFDTALDIVDQREKNALRDQLLGLGSRAQQDKDAAAQSMGVGIAPALENLKASTMGRPLGSQNVFDADKIMEEEEKFGTLSPKTLVDIERLSNVPIGQRKIGEGDDPTFFSRFGLPSIFDGIERFSRDRMAAKLARGDVPEKNIVRNDSGLVIGIKDNFGNLVEGMDPNQQLGGDDSGPDPIIRPLTPKKPEVDKPNLPPNVIGGTALTEIPQLPTVVESPFTASSVGSTPVTFDAGDLNRLIEQLTGVSARPVVSAKKGGVIGMANGGLIKAVDDFLAAS